MGNHIGKENETGSFPHFQQSHFCSSKNSRQNRPRGFTYSAEQATKPQPNSPAHGKWGMPRFSRAISSNVVPSITAKKSPEQQATRSLSEFFSVRRILQNRTNGYSDATSLTLASHTSQTILKNASITQGRDGDKNSSREIWSAINMSWLWWWSGNGFDSDMINDMHYMLKRVFCNKNILCTDALCALEGSHARCLDVGHGNGTWLMEMATEFPFCEFFGIDYPSGVDHDLFPSSIRPANCNFLEHSILTERLPFPDDYFHLVHQRNFLVSIPSNYFLAHFSELYRVTSPFPGLIELIETNFKHRSVGEFGRKINSWFNKLMESFCAGYASNTDGERINAESVERIAGCLSEAGWEDIETRVICIPSGDWAGTIGKISLAYYIDKLCALKPKIIKLAFSQELPAEQAEAIFTDTLERWKSEVNSLRSYWEVHVAIARKKA